MKAEIKRDGTLKITAETELEAYALTVWADSQMKINAINSTKLLFWTNIEGDHDYESRD